MALVQFLGRVYQHTTFYVAFVDICSNATINISLSVVGGVEEDILASFTIFLLLLENSRCFFWKIQDATTCKMK